MTHVLLTQNDPKLIDAARAVLPEATVAILGDRVPDVTGEHIWCFVDWLLENMSGLEMCRRLREAPQTKSAHITLVLDSDDNHLRGRALAEGADDYILGPLTEAKLIDRLGRYTASFTPKGSLSSPLGLSLNREAHQVRWQGRPIPMGPRELRLLELFLLQPDQLLTREKIIAHLNQEGEINYPRTVDVLVSRLRRRLSVYGLDENLRSVRSRGYILDTL